MNTDHRAFLSDIFQYRAPPINGVCHGRSEPLLDVWEAIRDWQTARDAARCYAFEVMEHIGGSISCLLQNLEADLTLEGAE